MKLGIKVKGSRGPRIKVRVRELSPLRKPRTLLRPKKLRLRQRKQRPRPNKLIQRPRTLLSCSKARKKLLLLQRPRLNT